MGSEDYTAKKFQDSRAAEARRLRVEEGMSSKDIRERLGVDKNRLQYWLAGLPGNRSNLRLNAKDHLRDEARRMRSEGKDYGQIEQALGVSRSSISLWVRDIVVDIPSKRCKSSWSESARAKREDTKRQAREEKFAARRDRLASAVERIGALSGRELLLAGAVAYWCEGTKWKDWQLSPPGFDFINSDPRLVRLFLRFLSLVPVRFGDLRFRLNIHESGDELAAKEYWAREIGIGLADFQKTTFKHHNPKTIRKNTGDDYYGCLTVRVLRCRELFDYLDDVVTVVDQATALDGTVGPLWGVQGG